MRALAAVAAAPGAAGVRVWEVMSRGLGHGRGDRRRRVLVLAILLVNDVLIALSARSIGATVVTNNARDFAAIREVRPFALTIVPA
jgi:predicted nucleic acid-binding protein